MKCTMAGIEHRQSAKDQPLASLSMEDRGALRNLLQDTDLGTLPLVQGIASDALVSRRTALKAIVVSLAASLIDGLENNTQAAPALKKISYDINYISSKDIQDVLELMENLESTLGPDVAKDLRVVQFENNYFGLVYDRDGDQAGAQRVARSHARLLKEADLGEPIVVRSDKFSAVYNISFGKGPNLEVLKRNYQVVTTMLGGGVKDNLVIEQANDGDYALVYKRLGNLADGVEAAERFTKLLKSTGLKAAVIEERNNDQVYGNSSFLNDAELEPKAAERVKQFKKLGGKESTHRHPSTSRSDLEARVEKLIASFRASGKLSRDERTAFSIYDFKTGQKLVSVNEDVPMQAASMIKVFVALAFFHKVQNGTLEYGPRSKRNLQKMIQHSSNTATNWCIDQIGGPKQVQAILKQHYGEIAQDTRVVEKIPGGGRTYRNVASAHDYSRFLFALWNDDLPHASEIRRLMALPGPDRIKNRAAHVPSGTVVINKTGTTSRLCGDMGILVVKDHQGNRHAYTVVGIVEKASRCKDYKTWMRQRGQVIGRVSDLAYQAIMQD